MLSDVRPQIKLDEAAEGIIALATSSAERLINKLLIDSIKAWSDVSFGRYDEREISFTVRLYAYMLAVKQSNRGGMLLLHLQYDGPLPSRGMLLGTEDAGRTPRPDLTVKCGDASIHVEAKIVAPKLGLPAKYVRQGMARFIDGRYVSPGISIALMLGYVTEGSPDECYEAINNVIANEPGLGSEQITKLREIVDPVSIYDSSHGFGDIAHYAIDVRGRESSFAQDLKKVTDQ